MHGLPRAVLLAGESGVLSLRSRARPAAHCTGHGPDLWGRPRTGTHAGASVAVNAACTASGCTPSACSARNWALAMHSHWRPSLRSFQGVGSGVSAGHDVGLGSRHSRQAHLTGLGHAQPLVAASAQRSGRETCQGSRRSTHLPRTQQAPDALQQAERAPQVSGAAAAPVKAGNATSRAQRDVRHVIQADAAASRQPA